MLGPPKTNRMVILVFPDGTIMGSWADWVRNNPLRYKEGKRITTFRVPEGKQDKFFRIACQWAMRMGYAS